MLFNIILKIEKYKWNKEYGVYVSNLGHFKDRYKRRLPVKINKKGYVTILTEKGFKSGHRLVMLTWQPIPNAEELTVDHLDHNKRNNELTNLEWISQEENSIRAKKDFINDKNKFVLYDRDTQRVIFISHNVKNIIEYIYKQSPNYFRNLSKSEGELIKWIEKRAKSNKILKNKTLNSAFLIDYKK